MSNLIHQGLQTHHQGYLFPEETNKVVEEEVETTFFQQIEKKFSCFHAFTFPQLIKKIFSLRMVLKYIDKDVHASQMFDFLEQNFMLVSSESLCLYLVENCFPQLKSYFVFCNCS